MAENKKQEYRKTYKNDLFFFIPYAMNKMDQELDAEKITELVGEAGRAYIEAIEENAVYECTNHVVNQMRRICLGSYKFACMNDDYDGTVLAYEDAEFVLTVHENSGLGVLCIIIPDNKFSTTQLEDQMSSRHLEVLDERTGKNININELMREKFGMENCGDAKCLVCMSNEPENPEEMAYILAAEAFNSSHIDYRIVNRDVLDWKDHNIAKYDYYDAYLSDCAIAFVMKDYPEDFAERLGIEATYLFVVELTVFQHSAVTRTNMRIVEELDCPHGTDLDFVQELYDEFGRTIRFWEWDNFKYPMAQCEADEIIKAFDTRKIMSTYNRNQAYLERLIELRNARSNERENRMLNATVLVLTFLQITTVITGAVHWLINFFGINQKVEIPMSIALLALVLGAVIYIMIKMWRRKKN